MIEATVIRTASGETANVSVTAVAKGAQFVERRRHPRLPLIEGGARRLRHKEYRRAAVAAGALTVIIMGLWIALAARQSASPLASKQLVQSAGMEQASPFGPVKLNAPVQTSRPAEPAAQSVVSKQAVKPKQAQSASVHPTSKKKPVAAKPTAKKKSRNARRSTANSDEEQEVVVRRFGAASTGATTTKKTASTKDGVKVFSDME
jgi:hypothetical protein